MLKTLIHELTEATDQHGLTSEKQVISLSAYTDIYTKLSNLRERSACICMACEHRPRQLLVYGVRRHSIVPLRPDQDNCLSMGLAGL